MDDLQRAKAAFASAIGRGDARLASELYAHRARLLLPRSGLVEGRAAIERFWRTGIGVGVSGLESVTLKCEQRHGVAFEVGRYVLRLSGDGDVAEHGSYLLVHERQEDGAWQRAAEMFSPDGEIAQQVLEEAHSHMKGASHA